MIETEQDQYLEQFTVLAQKAADLWMGLLEAPKYDNGDDSREGVMTSVMARMLPSNANGDNIKLFGEKVVKLLLEKWTEDKENGWYDLSTDYGPCEMLGKAAEEAELKIEFPWKTNLSIRVISNCVTMSAGYGAPTAYHYPLENGKCLVTTLTGDDMDKIKDHIVNGTPLEFKVE